MQVAVFLDCMSERRWERFVRGLCAGLLLLAAAPAAAKPKRGKASEPPPAPAPATPGDKAAPPAAAPPPRDAAARESRIEFDERLVQGQTAAGAVYLFQRGSSEFRSMVQAPDNFRIRTIRTVYPDRSEKQ
jgi:hypothetical protein